MDAESKILGPTSGKDEDLTLEGVFFQNGRQNSINLVCCGVDATKRHNESGAIEAAEDSVVSVAMQCQLTFGGVMITFTMQNKWHSNLFRNYENRFSQVSAAVIGFYHLMKKMGRCLRAHSEKSYLKLLNEMKFF